MPNGLSLARIATDLHVSQPTLTDWNRQFAPDIRALRALRLEALHQQTLAISSLRSLPARRSLGAGGRLCVLITHSKPSPRPHPVTSVPYPRSLAWGPWTVPKRADPLSALRVLRAILPRTC